MSESAGLLAQQRVLHVSQRLDLKRRIAMSFLSLRNIVYFLKEFVGKIYYVDNGKERKKSKIHFRDQVQKEKSTLYL